MSTKRFSPSKPLRERAREFGVSIAWFKNRIANDPDFPAMSLCRSGGSVSRGLA